MAVFDIESASNPRIKRLVGLRERTARDRESLFLIEGTREIDRAIGVGRHPREIYYDPARFDIPPFRADLVLRVEHSALDRASYRGRSQGVIGVFDQFSTSLHRLDLGSSPLLLMVEAVEKPGNLGGILRTADAVGADAVIATDRATDPFNPNVIRASTGALLSVPLAVSDLDTALAWLSDRQIRIIAADPAAPVPFWETDLTGSCALLVGSEHQGLSAGALSAADVKVSIPMHGVVDSLNASVSAALLAYEALRQRRS